MSKVSTAWAAFLAVLAIAWSSSARGDVQERTRVTIRGTGGNVTIDRGKGPVRKRSLEKSALSAGVLGEAIRLKAGGVDDSTVIAYLRAHQDELPPVIDNADVRRLRKAGAGKSVVAYLATVAAVDIGPTGEGRRTGSNVAAAEAAFETPFYGPPYGYPPALGYAAPRPARLLARGFLFRRMVFPRGRPVLRGPFPMHPVSMRRQIAE